MAAAGLCKQDRIVHFLGALPAEYQIAAEVERPQADDVRIDPPPSALGKKLVAEHVGEVNVAAAGLAVDMLPLDDDASILEHHPARHVQLLVGVEVILVSVREEGSHRQDLEPAESLPDPERLHGVLQAHGQVGAVEHPRTRS